MRYADYDNFGHNGPLSSWFRQVMSGIRSRKNMYSVSGIGAEILLEQRVEEGHSCKSQTCRQCAKNADGLDVQVTAVIQ